MRAPPPAHETWFVDGGRVDWSFAAEATTLALLGAAVAATLAARLLARLRSGIDVPVLARMAPYMPFAVRIHLAVSLVGLLSLGFYLSPAMDLQADPAGIALGAGMALVAISMATGWRTREGAWLLVALGPIGMLEFGAGPVLQRLDVLGLAAYVLIAGPGRWSADAERGAAREPSEEAMLRAAWALRVAAGGALIAVAFAEKLANPELALALIDERPELNVAARLGLPLGELEFVRVAGAIEVCFGLLLMSGALPQPVVVAAGIPFNATLWFFGNTELVGHLPMYAAMLVLLVLGSDPRLRPRLADPWPWGATRDARMAPASPSTSAG